MTTNYQPVHTLTAALAAIAILAACGGGGGGSPTASMPTDPGTGTEPTTPIEPDTPAAPSVADSRTVTNTGAIDPTLAFRAVTVPTEPGFTVTRTAPSSPVIEFNRHDGPRAAELAPTDLDAMVRRAGHLWTRRLTDGGTYPVELYVAFPQAEQCPGEVNACAFEPSSGGASDNAGIRLPDGFLAVGQESADSMLQFGTFGTIVHEVGHALAFRVATTGRSHADCAATQVMCGTPTARDPANPNEADFAGLNNWTVGPPVPDYQDFGLWADVAGTGNLNGFGITVRRTLNVEDTGRSRDPAADRMTDTIRLQARVDGTASSGPAAGLGTATWSGIFLGADSRRFEPVTGDATLTADLADLAAIDLTLSGLERTDAAGQEHPLAAIAYELERHGDAWIDADGRADAAFYAVGNDPAGSAAGIVNDAGRELIGAWGGTRQ